MGDQRFQEYFYRSQEVDAAGRWYPAASRRLRSAGSADQEGSRGVDAMEAAGEQDDVLQGGDVVSARMRLLYDYRAPAGTRWSPTAEQLRELLALFHIGGVRTPSTAQISRITARLRTHGRIEGRNVFYWFQNQKARERKRRQLQLLQQSNTSTSSQHPQQPAAGDDHQVQAAPSVQAAQGPDNAPPCKRLRLQELGAAAPPPPEEGDVDARANSLTRALLPGANDQLQQMRSSGEHSTSASSSAGEYYTSPEEQLQPESRAAAAAGSTDQLALCIPMNCYMEPADHIRVAGRAGVVQAQLAEDEKSEVSDAEVNFIYEQRPAARPAPMSLSLYAASAGAEAAADDYLRCFSRRETQQINNMSTGVHDFDEIDSVSDLNVEIIKPLHLELMQDDVQSPVDHLHAAAYNTCARLKYSVIRQEAGAAQNIPFNIFDPSFNPTLPLFPLSPSSTSSSTTVAARSTPSPSTSFLPHITSPASLTLHGHPACPPAFSINHHRPLDLKLSIDH